jgi:hypothetical protein
LNEQGPARKTTGFDALEEVALMSLSILAYQGLGLGIGQVLDALLSAKVEFDPGALLPRIKKTVSMAAEAVHVAKAARDTALAHHDGDLMQGLRQQGPEVPIVIRAAHARTRIALDGVIEVGETQRVAEKEYRRIIAYHIPIALLRVELQGEAANVALCVGCAALSGDSGETGEHRSLLPYLGENLRFGIAADVMRDREGAMGTRALGVHAPLGNHFTVEVSEFLDQPDVLQQSRAARAGGLNIEIVADRRARCVGQVWGGGILLHCSS